MLVKKKRKDISERLEAAISLGDLSENADYAQAKEEQSFIEGKIQEIEEMILNGLLEAAPWYEIKQNATFSGAIEKHIEHIMENSPLVAKLKVVLDCGCGAASLITPNLLKQMGLMGLLCLFDSV